MKNTFLLFLGITILGACKKEDKTSITPSNPYVIASDTLNNLIDFNSFTLRTPKGWKKVILQGTDSYYGGIKTNNNDTVYFDLGWYSNSLEVDSKTHAVSYDMIDNCYTKIVSPNTAGNGTTGIYIEKLRQSELDRFNLYAQDLTKEDQNNLLVVFRTLKFKK